MTTMQNSIVGVIAAFLEGVILQPTLYWKNARAQRMPFTLNPRVIYRGTAASIFNEMQMMGVQFGVTAYTQKLLSDTPAAAAANNATHRKFTDYSAAFIGGVVSSTTASPLELVMRQQQKNGGTIMATVQRIVASGGIFLNGLMRGYGNSNSTRTGHTLTRSCHNLTRTCHNLTRNLS